MNGILNILKPPGMTSHDMVSAVRRLTGVRRTGHTGTLDPGAAGVLPICVGQATRVSEYVLEMDKTYRAEVTLGTATDTEDVAGIITSEKPLPVINEEVIRAVMASFVGKRRQVPPMYSAVRINGEKLYEKARRGETVKRDARPITIYHMNFLRFEGRTILFDVSCSRGTYIRTICRELAEALGTVGHMSFLLRTQVGPFSLAHTYTLDELNKFSQEGRLAQALLPLDFALTLLAEVHVSAVDVGLLQNGVAIAWPDTQAEGTKIRVYGPTNSLVAIANVIDGYIRPHKVFL